MLLPRSADAMCPAPPVLANRDERDVRPGPGALRVRVVDRHWLLVTKKHPSDHQPADQTRRGGHAAGAAGRQGRWRQARRAHVFHRRRQLW